MPDVLEFIRQHFLKTKGKDYFFWNEFNDREGLGIRTRTRVNLTNTAFLYRSGPNQRLRMSSWDALIGLHILEYPIMEIPEQTYYNLQLASKGSKNSLI